MSLQTSPYPRKSEGFKDLQRNWGNEVETVAIGYFHKYNLCTSKSLHYIVFYAWITGWKNKAMKLLINRVAIKQK